MKKLLPYIVAGVLVIGGAAAFFVLKDKKTTDSTQTQSSVSLNFDSSLCDQIPSSVAEKALNKGIVKTETNSNATTNVCQYYIDDTHFVTLRLNSLDYEKQKQDQTALDRTITTNESIKAEHFIAVQEDGLINSITFKLDNGLILAVDRSSGSAFNEADVVTFASSVAKFLQSGSPSSGTTNNDTSVPKPQDEDVVRNFFQLIAEDKASEAVMAMSSKNMTDDSTKQAWGVQFNNMNSVKVVSVEPASQDSWTKTKHVYKIVLDVVMDPKSANAPIPYYGYENGQNTRFVPIVSENGLWKVDEIATGP